MTWTLADRIRHVWVERATPTEMRVSIPHRWRVLAWLGVRVRVNFARHRRGHWQFVTWLGRRLEPTAGNPWVPFLVRVDATDAAPRVAGLGPGRVTSAPDSPVRVTEYEWRREVK